MSIRPSKAAIALVVVLVGVLLTTLVPHAPFRDLGHAEATSSSVSYAENGTGPVARFSATDQDGDPIAWSLSGADSGAFTIVGGELRFAAPPDYENATDTGGQAGDNVYEVTVNATGGSLAVTVTVTNVDEPGSVSIDLPQPQLGLPITATTFDPDGTTTKRRHQWSRSGDQSSWTNITSNATSGSYVPVSADVGYYLRVTVTYTDVHGAGKSVSAITMNAVEGTQTQNAAPVFNVDARDDFKVNTVAKRGKTITLEMAENLPRGSNVGNPVFADDADNDELVYDLVAPTADDNHPDYEENRADNKSKFKIDPLTGQIRTDASFNFEDPAAPEGNKYKVTVEAKDPSGATGTVAVDIEVTNAADKPKFVPGSEGDWANPSVLYVLEHAASPLGGDGKAKGQIYVYKGAGSPSEINRSSAAFATDFEMVRGTIGFFNVDDDDEVNSGLRVTVVGQDASFFEIDSSGSPFLKMKANQMNSVDFEVKSSYSISARVTDATGLMTEHPLTVFVLNGEDDGAVSLSTRGPHVDSPITASLSDPDGGIINLEWKWQRSTSDEATNCESDSLAWDRVKVLSTTASYTPKDDDVGHCLRAVATYEDSYTKMYASNEGVRPTDEVIEAVDSAVKVRPETNGAPTFLGASTTLRVSESAIPRTAIDAAVVATDPDGDKLVYTLSGTDVASFTIDRAGSSEGQIRAKAPLDFESKRAYQVTVTATDPSGASSSIAVTINVDDANDVAQITGPSSASYAENGTSAVAHYTATDQDGDAITWSLGGDDKGLFSITGGSLRFNKSPDFVTDGSNDNIYQVTVKATGGSKPVVITVTNVDEAGSVTFKDPQPQAGRSLAATLEDPDIVGTKTWRWARSTDKSTWVDIPGASNFMRRVSTDDVGHYLRATVTYADEHGSGKMVAGITQVKVEGSPLTNSGPTFQLVSGKTSIERTISENLPIGSDAGDPVVATDADNDTLVYGLSGSSSQFDIDSATGQITSRVVLDREGEDSRESYTLTVTATDPSGAPGRVNVLIKVEEVNEAPTFELQGDNPAPDTLWIKENAGSSTTVYVNRDVDSPVTGTNGAYKPIDEDVGDTPTVSLAGPDAASFGIDRTTGVMSVAADTDPDFEMKQEYSVIVRATDGTLTNEKSVTVRVKNSQDSGSIRLSALAPQPGKGITATLSDPDGGIHAVKWQWFRKGGSDDPKGLCPAVTGDEVVRVDDQGQITLDGDWTAIDNMETSAYTPVGDNVGQCLAVVARYYDSINLKPTGSTGSTPEHVVQITVGEVQQHGNTNKGPKFTLSTTTREVRENTDPGEPFDLAVTATDGDEEDDPVLLYTLGGVDAASFDIDRTDGQLKTKAKLDYETKNVYRVTVTATDPSGASDSTDVTINILDINDNAVIIIIGPGNGNSAPSFGAASAVRSVAENSASGTPIGSAVAATDADGNTLSYSLSGADAGSFTINASSGQLSTSSSLDYETKATYSVTVAASDGQASATIAVTINVTDVSESSFDTNGNGTIERSEVLSGIRSYFAGQVQRQQVIALIGRYFSGS